MVNQKGQTVLNDQEEPIIINAKGADISIDGLGNIYAGSGQGNVNIGKINIINFKNQQTMEKLGDGLFYQSDTDAEIEKVKNTRVRHATLSLAGILPQLKYFRHHRS